MRPSTCRRKTKNGSRAPRQALELPDLSSEPTTEVLCFKLQLLAPLWSSSCPKVSTAVRMEIQFIETELKACDVLDWRTTGDHTDTAAKTSAVEGDGLGLWYERESQFRTARLHLKASIRQ